MKSRRRYSKQVRNEAARQAGFTLTEMLIALLILSFGLLSAGQLMYVAMSSSSLARSKSSAASVAQDKLEFLADLYRREPGNEDLALGDHGPQVVQVTNPNGGGVLNRFRVEWQVSPVPDPRPGKTLASRLVRVRVTPIGTDGSVNSRIGLNKVVNMTSIFSPRAS